VGQGELTAWPHFCLTMHCTLQAIIACRCQRAAPTLTTIFEIAALTAPLIKAPNATPPVNTSSTSSAGGTDSDSSNVSVPTTAAAAQSPGSSSGSSSSAVLQSPLGVSHAVLLLGLRLVQGWAPAVVVAQGVRLVASLVQRREQPNEPVRQEGTEGASSVLGRKGVHLWY
jgi:hypothetical protein